MKKFLLICSAMLLAASSINAAKVTEGANKKYTFADLVDTDSIVTFDGIYHVLDDVEIAATDTLVLDPGCIVSIAAKKTITIKGVADFAPSIPSIITAEDPTAAPKGVKLSDAGTGVFRNVTFNYAAIYTFATGDLTVENCSFNLVTKAMNSTGAVALGKTCNFAVRNCTFFKCNIPAVGGAANAYNPGVIENCFIYDCNLDNSNRPMLNMTMTDKGQELIIRNNSIIGTGLPKVGGISVSSMTAAVTGKCLIENNTIRNCRYGLNVLGSMFTVEVRNNKFIDNRYEPNPMNGGSGISITNSKNTLNVICSGNYIEGSLWGVTVLYGGQGISFGDPANSSINSPGGNIFVNNGNDGTNYDPTTPYDFYNNTPDDIYAQRNIWSVDEQTQEKIETVITHKVDNPELGEVIFMGPSSDAPSVISDFTAGEKAVYDAATDCVISAEPITSMSVYTIDGRCVYTASAANHVASLANVAHGTYVINVTTAAGATTLKVSK